MTVANAPAGKAHLDIIHICFVIAITVRYKKQVEWSANENAIKANCQSGGKGDPFHKYFFRIRFPVMVGVFQDQSTAVSRTRKAVCPGFVVPGFCNPQPSSTFPAKCHWLGDHGLFGPTVCHTHTAQITERLRL